MSDDELAELAGGATVVDFPAGAAVANYATRVPDDVWMVRTGIVALRAIDDGVSSTASDLAAFSATCRCCRRRHGFRGPHHRAEHADPVARRVGAGPVRQARGSGFPGVVGVESGHADRPTIAPATDSRPVAELVHGEVLLVRPDTRCATRWCR